MHSPPWDTMGEAVTFWMDDRPSSPMAHSRCRNISYRTGSSSLVSVMLGPPVAGYRSAYSSTGLS